MLFVFFGLPVFSGRIKKSYFYTEFKMKTRKCSPYVNELSVVVAFKKFHVKDFTVPRPTIQNIRFRQPLSFCMENLQIPLLNKAILITWQRNICS